MENDNLYKHIQPMMVCDALLHLRISPSFILTENKRNMVAFWEMVEHLYQGNIPARLAIVVQTPGAGEYQYNPSALMKIYMERRKTHPHTYQGNQETLFFIKDSNDPLCETYVSRYHVSSSDVIKTLGRLSFLFSSQGVVSVAWYIYNQDIYPIESWFKALSEHVPARLIQSKEIQMSPNPFIRRLKMLHGIVDNGLRSALYNRYYAENEMSEFREAYRTIFGDNSRFSINVNYLFQEEPTDETLNTWVEKYGTPPVIPEEKKPRLSAIRRFFSKT